MKKTILIFYTAVFLLYFSNGYSQDTDAFHNRLELGTDISPIFSENNNNFPGSFMMRLYFKNRPLAWRLSINNNTYVQVKTEVEGTTEQESKSTLLSGAVGIDWFFLQMSTSSIYLGNHISINTTSSKQPRITNDIYAKQSNYSDSFVLGFKINVYKKLSVNAESILSIGVSKGKDEWGRIKTSSFYTQFDSFSTLNLLYHF
jgi:hypothetical protein